MNAMEKTSKHLCEFIKYLQVEKNASLHTVHSYRADIDCFIAFARLQGAVSEALFSEVDNMLIRAYIASQMDRGYAPSTISRRISALKAFFRFLTKAFGVDNYPFAGIHIKVEKKALPAFLSMDEITKLLSIPVNDWLGIRDMAILELLYGAGLRVGELTDLKVKDVDLEAGYVLVYGKRAKERIVPIGQHAVSAVSRYLLVARPYLCEKCQAGLHEFLFVNAQGASLSERSVRRIINKYAEKIALGKNMNPRTFRYTLEAHLLQNGADLLTIQRILGQAELKMKSIAPHQEQLQSVYKGAHPRA